MCLKPNRERHPAFIRSVWGGLALAVLTVWCAPTFASEPPPLVIAIAAPLSGSGAHIGPEIVNAVHMLVDDTNKAGGIGGRQVAVQVFDDTTSPDGARKAAEAAAASPALVVIGHPHSPVALAASPIYQAAHLPLLSSAAETSLTTANPFGFRIVPSLDEQGRASAIYAREELRLDRATVVHRDDNFGHTLRQAFTAEFTAGRLAKVRTIALPKEAIDWPAIIAQVANDPQPGLIVLAMQDYDARPFLIEMKRRGLAAPVMGPQAVARDIFVSLFKDLPEERDAPGYFAEGVYAMAPAILDTANKDTVDFAAAYRARFGAAPGWLGVKYYEAAQAVIAAMGRTGLSGRPDSITADRDLLRDALTGLGQSVRPPAGLTGPIRFDAQRNRVDSFRVGRFQGGRFVSAPIQFVRIGDPATVNLQRGLAADTIRRIGDAYYWRQRIVFTGLQILAIDKIDTKDAIFSADFYMWMRFVDRDGIAEVEFPDMIRGSYNPAQPVASRRVDGTTYLLYRIKADFRNEFALGDYPFDQQRLVIRVANTRLTRDEVVYAVDNLAPAQPIREAGGLRMPEQWENRGVERFRDDIVSKTALGDPDAILSGRALEFSGFKAVTTAQRQVVVFLKKNLLPLGLLTLVVYSTLFYPESMLKERLTVPVATILAASVLLSGNQAKLGDIGYTTVVEIIFYLFFVVSLLAMLSALLEERLRRWRVLALVTRRGSHILFPVTVAGAALAFAVHFSERF